MKEVFQSHGISEVSYKHWVSQPRATLETLKIPVDDFVNNFYSYGKKFLSHSYIADQQPSYYRFVKKKSAMSNVSLYVILLKMTDL